MKYFYNLALFFESIVESHKDKVVLKYIDKTITYSGFNNLSNKIGKILLDNNVQQNDVVGIFNSKEPIGYATMIACLKIGAIYTNIDEENPKERLKKIFATCNPKMVISDHLPNQTILETISELFLHFEILDSEEKLEGLMDDNLEKSSKITGSTPAYIMFTSGSTGIPKGVLISHANVISFINWSIHRYSVKPSDIFTQVSPIYFDNSVFDFYTALFSGAALAPVKPEILKKPLELIKLVDTLECTIWFSVPSLLIYLTTLRVLSRKNMKNIRIFTFGGEGYPKKELKKLYDLYNDRAIFINVYGPTEGTCICSSYTISDKDFENFDTLPPLGPINQNFNFLILDENNNEVTVGEKGELCLLGPNVGIGYYNDKERTDKSFVSNPRQGNFYDKMYKTGDIVSIDENGLLWFAGRKDNQIKHMGYRIELEEIETTINKLDYVNQSAVIYNRVKVGYGKIIAFVAPVDKNVSENEIKRDLSNLLPEYMIPNIVEIWDMLPKNANGKVDRKLLENQVGNVSWSK